MLPGKSDPKVHGWVKRFAEQLETWLRDQRRLADLKVWLDLDRLSGATQFNERIRTDLGRTAILLVLHSHNYRDSDYCRQELEWFLDAAAKQPPGLAPGGVRRVFNVVINKVPHEDWDDTELWAKAFAGTPGFPFHDAPDDDPDAFGDPLSETDPSAYRDGLKPIVNTAYKLLKSFPRRPEPSTAAEPEDDAARADQRPLVFLGDCPDTHLVLRDRLTDELTPLVRLVPSIPPPYAASEHDELVRRTLAGADLSIHLLDGLPGRRMDGGAVSYCRG